MMNLRAAVLLALPMAALAGRCEDFDAVLERGEFLASDAIKCWTPFFLALFVICNILFTIGATAYAYMLAKRSAAKKNADGTNEQVAYEEHYLGGKSFGTFVLTMTTFSTVYSGYTVVGVPNESSALGFFAFRWLGLAICVSFTFMLFCPRLRRISVARNYLAPSDPVTDRFNNKGITIISTIMMCASNLLYIIANFRALRSLFLSLFGESEATTNGLVFFMGLLMWLCEISGGMRSVSFTDAVQSTIMLICMFLLPIMAVHEWGAYSDIVPWDCKQGSFPGGVNTRADSSVGCLQTSATTAGFLTVHPTVTEKSVYFKSYWEGYHMVTDKGLTSFSTCPESERVEGAFSNFDCSNGIMDGGETGVDCCMPSDPASCKCGRNYLGDDETKWCDGTDVTVTEAPTKAPTTPNSPTKAPTEAPTKAPTTAPPPSTPSPCYWKEFKDGDWSATNYRYNYAYVHYKDYNASSEALEETAVYHSGFYTANYADGSATKLSTPFWHYDGLKYYSGSTVSMFSFMVLFIPFFLNPHWIQRTMAAKTDAALKKTTGFLIMSGLIATVPGLYLGIVHATQLKDCFRTFDSTYNKKYISEYGLNAAGEEVLLAGCPDCKPLALHGNTCKLPLGKGTEVFPTFVQFFIYNGGFGSFVGAFAGTSAIAAIMSTADSAVIGVGSLITRDIISGWLAPDMKTATLMQISKVISFVIIFIAILVPLYDEQIKTNGLIYGFLIALQCAMLWQTLPAYFFSLFGRSNNPTPILAGMITGLISLAALFVATDPMGSGCGKLKSCYATGFANAKDYKGEGEGITTGVGGTLLDPGVWAGIINFATVMLLNAMNVPNVLGQAWEFSAARMSTYGAGILDTDAVKKIMAGTSEPMDYKKNPLGFGCMTAALICMTLSFPWWGEPTDGCTKITHDAFIACEKTKAAGDVCTDADIAKIGSCAPVPFVGGLPSWAFGMHIGWAISIVLLEIGVWSWKVTDDGEASVSNSQVAPAPGSPGQAWAEKAVADK